MNAQAILTRLLRAGWEVWREDDDLLVRHATQTLTPAQRQYLEQHKAALLAALDAVLAFEERAAIAEYCGGLAREEAEQVARQCLERKSNARSLGTAGVQGEPNQGVDSCY